MDRKRYDLELLNSFVKDNKVELIGNYENVNRETKISGKCLTLSCEDTFCKNFSMLINNGGAYCKECVKKIKTINTKKTCLKKYGCEYSFQNEEVKEKIKQTCLDKYGVENPNKCDEVKEKIKQTCLDKYGVENPNKCDEVKEKSKKTCLEKYGCEYSFQNEEVKEKYKKTCLKKYGFENTFQNLEVKEKIKQTCLNKYGVENPIQNLEVREKIKKTCSNKYGVENPSQCEKIKEKKKETYLEKFGVENPMQSEEIFEKQLKNSLNKKEYILPSSKSIQVQGYENLALDILIYNENIDENDIIINRSEVPEIWYDDNGKYHRYYVDIFIKSLNKCIEVKSEYTFYINKKINLLKHKYVKYNGYNSEIWIFSGKKRLIKVIQ